MIREFIDEKFERDSKSYVSAKEIHEMYIKYTDEKGRLDNISQIALTKRLNNLRIGAPKRKALNGGTILVRYGLKVK